MVLDLLMLLILALTAKPSIEQEPCPGLPVQ